MMQRMPAQMECLDDTDFMEMHPAMPSAQGLCAGKERQSVGMAYVPMQQWRTPYNMREGFDKGTIFPDLYKPFQR